MTKIKSCLLCENYQTHPCECEHCEDWDNFRISESGKALREKIYGDGYQDGYKDGYDKGYDDAQANYERPQGEWEKCQNNMFRCSKCRQADEVPTAMGEPIYNFCPNCGIKMRKGGTV